MELFFLHHPSEGVDRQLNKQEQQCKEHGKPIYTQVRERMAQESPNIVRDGHRVAQDIPTIPAIKAAQENSEAAQESNRDGEQPTGQPSECVCNDLLHEIKRYHAQEQTSPCKPDQHEHVLPERCITRIGTQVLEIRQDIRCIGKKD